jgi:dTDP-4-dehydrorhamnose reductase
VKVLITGSGGQVGQALIATVPARIEAVVLPREDLDLTDRGSIARALDRSAASLVINAAAYTAVDRAETDEDLAFAVNGAGVAALAELCAERGIRLVHISTDFVFDGRQSQPYRVDNATGPQSVYGGSKLAGETAALMYADNLVVRTAWVYGNHGHNFAKTMLRLFGERDVVRVVADQVGTPTYARSLAEALWDLAARDARGLLQFTDAGVASWYDFAVAICEEARALGLLDREVAVYPIATADYPTPAARPAYSVLDKSETWALLGRPARHWRVELRDMLRTEKELHG